MIGTCDKNVFRSMSEGGIKWEGLIKSDEDGQKERGNGEDTREMIPILI
jgi:hypothetical protein